MPEKPLLILIFGASGSGKTSLMNELRNTGKQLSIHQKVTDRPPKKYDSDEIRCVKSVPEERYKYIYRQYGYSYGIEKAQIDQALNSGKDHFLICNDIDTIKRFRHDYGDAVRTLFLLFNAPRAHIESVQKTRGISDEQVDLRLIKIRVLSELFLDNSELFNGVILNRLGAPSIEMVRQVEAILGRKYTSDAQVVTIDSNLLHEMVDIIKIVNENLKRPGLEVPMIQSAYVFILMAMIKEDPHLDDTHMTIKRAAVSCGLRAERVDDIVFTEQITDKVLGSIKCAEYIVADLTHERPNVYYEIGYAHAHHKRTVLTARSGTKPHFDIQGFPIIFYESVTVLERELVRFFHSYQGIE